MHSASITPLRSNLLADDPEMRELVVEFVEGLDLRLSDLQAAIRAADWERMRVLGHQLKGAGGSYGYAEISELGSRMESSFRDHRDDTVSTLVSEFRQMVAAARAGLTS